VQAGARRDGRKGDRRQQPVVLIDEPSPHEATVWRFARSAIGVDHGSRSVVRRGVARSGHNAADKPGREWGTSTDVPAALTDHAHITRYASEVGDRCQSF
jgi:hypothetical protein